jgi:hypothetical protein
VRCSHVVEEGWEEVARARRWSASAEPGAGGGRGADAVDAAVDVVNLVLYVVGELVDAIDPGAGLGIGVVEGLTVVDGGVFREPPRHRPPTRPPPAP